MSKTLAVLLASAMFAASAGAGLACPYQSASNKEKLTVAETSKPAATDEEAMSTFDPKILAEEKKAE